MLQTQVQRIANEARIVEGALVRHADELLMEGRIKDAESLLPLIRWTQTLAGPEN